MRKYLVGGYYDSRIFEDAEGKTPFGKDISIYDLESALKLGFVESIVEWYEDMKEDDESEWDDLSDSRKVELILEYTESDEIAGLIAFDTLEEATKYIKDTISEILELEEEYEYIGKEQDIYGYFNEVYKKKEVE